jgi:SAM-dependent methyltransferase
MTALVAGTAETDIDGLKTRLKATWMDGNYDVFSRFMESSAVQFLDRLDIRAGTSLLDVACGSGQLALIAARRGANVTGVDIATNSIEAARGRAAAEGLDAWFDEGDAEALPYAEGRFDVVATIFGAMFAPRPELVARRAGSRLPARRDDSHGELDEGRIHWPDVQGHRAVHRASGHALAGTVGRRVSRA